MSVIYDTATKTARLEATVAQWGATAVLEIGTAGMGTVLATIPLANPAGTVTGDVLTLTQPLTDVAADATGTAAAARIRTATGGTNKVTGLTVGTSGSDINIASVDIVIGVSVSITLATITHAA